MVECIAEVSVLEIILLGEILQKFAARLLLVCVFIHSNIDRFSYKEIVEYFPSFLLYLFGEELCEFTRIKIGVELLDESLGSQAVIFFFA